MANAEDAKRAGVVDVSDFGERDIAGQYPPGTKFPLGTGEVIDPNDVPNILRDGPPKRGSKRKRPK